MDVYVINWPSIGQPFAILGLLQVASEIGSQVLSSVVITCKLVDFQKPTKSQSYHIYICHTWKTSCC